MKKEEIEEIVKRIGAMVEAHISSPRKEQVIKILSEFPDFLVAPASSKPQYHGCFEGGLILHTLHVMEVAIRLCDSLPFSNKEAALICALFHDFGKSTYYKKTAKGYEKAGSNPLPHSAESLFLLTERGLRLTQEEWQAILMHNGLYTPMGEETKSHESQLTYITHWADMWACYVIERTDEGKKP